MHNKTLIAICGATASGKTSLAIQVAQHYNTSILSFDSRQCYKELKIGVARPTEEELKTVPHYFIASHSIQDKVNAGVYEQFALSILEKLFQNSDTIIAVGGTGLYLNALTNGVDAIPEIPEYIRQELQQQYDSKGIDWLQNEIKKHDTSYTQPNDLNNVQRMLRALEVVVHTGKTIKAFHQQNTAERFFTIKKYAIAIDRETLYQSINNRVEQMILDGLEKEVEELYNFKSLNALQTVGYTELFEAMDKQQDKTIAINLIKQHTRNYAKRQLTWFRKDADIKWINSAEEIYKD